MRSFPRLATLSSAMVIVAMACSLPIIGQRATATPAPAEALSTRAAQGFASMGPVPPSVIETSPAKGEELDPGGSLTLYFDQPMNRSTVEAAFRMQPAIIGSFVWPRPDTLRFTPEQPLARGATYVLSLASSARSAVDIGLAQPFSLQVQTAGFVQVTQVIPADGTNEVSPESVITVVFNRPIVPLQFEGDLPQPLEFDPSVEGTGDWVDTGVYVFRPKDGLAGGVAYTATVHSGLTDISGSMLQDPFRWSFITSMPRLVSASPLDGQADIGLLDPIVLSFNQAMDIESVQESLSLRRSGSTNDLPGAHKWDDRGWELTFTPTTPLTYSTPYTVQLTTQARAAFGASLVNGLQASFRTVPLPAVVDSTPATGGLKPVYNSVEIVFNAPMNEASLIKSLSTTPALDNQGAYWDAERNTLIVFGDFKPATTYQITIDRGAQDPFGTPLAVPYELLFSTEHLPAQVDFTRFSEVVTFSSSRNPQIELQARNVSRIDLALYELTLEEFESQLQSGAYLYQDPSPAGQLRAEWFQALSLTPDSTDSVTVVLEDQPLPSGTYMLTIRAPEDDRGKQSRLVLVRDTELVFKATETEAFVWAVGLTDGESLPDLEIRILNEYGAVLASGKTGSEGTVSIPLPRPDDPYARLYASTGSPGGGRFGWTGIHWSSGMLPYEFGIPLDLAQPKFFLYLYTDRPIYRPGQTVSFRGVMRQTDGVQYGLPDLAAVGLQIRDVEGKLVHQASQSLSAFGTFNGQFTLSEDASTGTYLIRTDYGVEFFDVAAYRKPEFTVSVTPSSTNLAVGDPLQATIEASYYFGGPVDGAEVQWTAWAVPLLPSGLPEPVDWSDAGSADIRIFEYETLAEGVGSTDNDGRLTVSLPTDAPGILPALIRIEATLTDSSGLPVTATGSTNLHPATLYYSVVPRVYTLRAGQTAEVEATAVDWGGQPLPGQPVDLTVERITWQQTVDEEGRITWEEQETLVNQGRSVTADDGAVRFSFQPATGGTYRIRATGSDSAGREASGEATVWVSGEGGGIWRTPSAGKITLVPDHESYTPGDTAHVLVPSPFSEVASALVTIERSGVISYQVLQIRQDSDELEFPIDEAYAPNVFLTVTLIRPQSASGPAAIAVGMVPLEVSRAHLELQVTLSPSASEVGPGEPVSYQLQALDSQGHPVRAEFSMGLADLAALSLADPNSLNPSDAFYGDQPLRVRTGASLAETGEGGPMAPQVDGVGGGGDGLGRMTVRSEFPDTAYWNPSLVTDANGRAEIELTMPDSLTTWRMDVRGVTEDTRVGAATVDVVATKPLLIRPVTPRFFTAGDAASVAAVVHNNTAGELPLEAQLIASGAEITSSPSLSFNLAAGQSRRVEWQLTVQETDAVDLTFHVSGGGLEDASKPTVGSAADGSLPVSRYAAPQTAATAGSLDSGEARIEALSLPRSYSPSQGELRVELDPSLGSAMTSALQVLEAYPYTSTEQVVSRFLPDLAFYDALTRYGLGDSTLRSRLESTLNKSLQTLYSRQLSNGGFGWWASGPADSYITAYVIFGLAKASDAGFPIDEDVLGEASSYVRAGIVPTTMLPTAPLRDRQAFLLYCLQSAGEGYLGNLHELAGQREGMSLWSRALLTISLAELSPSDPSLDALRSDLETAANRSATGVSWQDDPVDRWNMGSAVRTTAHALQALLATDPENPLVASGVRWLLAARSPEGGWASTHETAWALMALIQWLDVQGGLQADFDYQVLLNGRTLTEAHAGPGSLMTAIELTEPVANLLSDQPNQLGLQRGAGPGTLFYTAHLRVFRPVEEIQPQVRGLSVSRRYFHYDGQCGSLEEPCREATSAVVGEDLLVRVSLVVPNDQYYVVVEDPFPAGAEAVDSSLRTSPSDIPLPGLTAAETGSGALGWWLFTRTDLRDDRLALFADYLPAGTYQYDYVLHATLAGEYRVLPTAAWAVYFPEVYGQAAGTVYTIEP